VKVWWWEGRVRREENEWVSELNEENLSAEGGRDGEAVAGRCFSDEVVALATHPRRTAK
jgi:hypothetical protein